MNKIKDQLKKLIIEGTLQEEFVLDHVKDLLNVLRESNFTLKWIMLHSRSKNKKLREIVTEGHKPEDLVELMLLLSKFENSLNVMF